MVWVTFIINLDMRASQKSRIAFNRDLKLGIELTAE